MTYSDLKIWQRADELAFEIYKITKKFPKDELYGITSQLRKAGLSVPTNIVEGYTRKGNKELARFIHISPGSLAEVEYLLFFSRKLDYSADNGEYEKIETLSTVVGKLLWNFYKKLS